MSTLAHQSQCKNTFNFTPMFLKADCIISLRFFFSKITSLLMISHADVIFLVVVVVVVVCARACWVGVIELGFA